MRKMGHTLPEMRDLGVRLLVVVSDRNAHLVISTGENGTDHPYCSCLATCTRTHINPKTDPTFALEAAYTTLYAQTDRIRDICEPTWSTSDLGQESIVHSGHV